MKRKSQQIALSSVSAALAALFLVIGKYVPVFELSAYMVAEIMMLIPLAKKHFMGGFLACIAASLIALLLAGGDFLYIMPFALFFGLHPLVNEIFAKYNFKKSLAFIIKALWFCGVAFLIYFFTKLFIADKNVITQFLDKYFYVFIPILSVAFIAFYDWFILKAYRIVKFYIEKLGF